MLQLYYQGQPVKLSETSEKIIGRKGFGADVEIDDPTVSRNHASIVLEKETILLKDLGSANGTFINGKKNRTTKTYCAQKWR